MLISLRRSSPTMLKLVANAACLALVACAEPPPETVVASARPVKTLEVTSPELGGMRQFPGRVDAERRVELAFRVDGRLRELPVKEAEEVAEGQVIARLDTTDFEVGLQNAEANLDKAKAGLTAAQASLNRQLKIQKADPGAISKSAIDKAREARDSARANIKALEAAVADASNRLERATLTAPFSGYIARRYVQNFEEVVAKQPVVALRDLSQLEVKFGMPEGVVQHLTDAKIGESDPDKDLPVTATFDAAPERQYRLRYREFSATADPVTKTFQLTYVMPRPDDIEVLPGMTTNVTVDMRKVFGGREIYLVPVTAVIADSKLNPRVWVVDESSMTVTARQVEVGKMQGSQIEVLSGIQPGEQVVVAGTGYLAEGMKVRALPHLEQAEDNIPRANPVAGKAPQG